MEEQDDSMDDHGTEMPVADFQASTVNGTAPFTVQFIDTSNGSPDSWSWDFGDGDFTNATEQNPVHTYASNGTYTVRLTASNAEGSSTKSEDDWITVATRSTWYVYADGVSLYHGFEGNQNLYRASTTAREFYNTIAGLQGDPYSSYHWAGIGNPVDDATGSRNWDINEDADSYANAADFAFHAGHGWNGGILFGTANTEYRLSRQNMRFGGNNGKAKWVALLSCQVLNRSTQRNWNSVFDGLHILMGYDTKGREGSGQGSQFAQRMTGGGMYETTSIRDAWKETLKQTIDDATLRGAYMYAEPCEDDYLPGFGNFAEPIKDDEGNYVIHWGSFTCERRS